MELDKRLKKVSALSEDVDAILLPSGNPNFFYFTNKELSGSFFYYDFSKPSLLTNAMEAVRASGWIKRVDVVENYSFITKTIKNRKIGIDAASMSVRMYQKLRKNSKIVDISKQLEQARAIKTSYEISCIKKACSIAKSLFGFVKEGISESHLAALLEFRIKTCRAEPAFPAIVAAGKNIAVPHHTPGMATVKKPFLVDMGARYNGYCSDITRAYGSSHVQLIENVFEKVEAMLMPGVSCSELDATARGVLGKRAKFFITGLGNGIGQSVHEWAAIASKSVDILEKGMTLSIEPGIYIKDGIRVENNYLITKNGFRNLTDF